jgi:hypothetical protein
MINFSEIKPMKINRYFAVLLIAMFFGCDHNKESKEKTIDAQHASKSTKVISNQEVKVTAIIDGAAISFDIRRGKERQKIKVNNAFGKLSFTSNASIVAYKNDRINLEQFLFCNNKFLIFPFEDWNSNLIFYKIPLNKKLVSNPINPFFILKEQYCLYNQRTQVLLTYEQDMKEYLISDESYFLTALHLFDLSSEAQDEIEFQTQRDLSLPENSSPQHVKKQLLKAISTCYEKPIFDAYFK